MKVALITGITGQDGSYQRPTAPLPGHQPGAGAVWLPRKDRFPRRAAANNRMVWEGRLRPPLRSCFFNPLTGPIMGQLGST
jgi:hypothetical protein